MSDDCNVCDFPVEFCGCSIGPQCTACGLPMLNPGTHDCPVIDHLLERHEAGGRSGDQIT